MDKKMYNLTFPQQNILFMERFNENSSVNVITGLINIQKDFDADLCKKAINEVIEKNIAMRTRLIEQDNEYMQYFEEYKYEEIEIVDMSSLSNEKIREYIDGLASQSLFSLDNKLYDFRILSYSNGKGSIFMRIHHIISDAWSCSKIGTYLIQVLESYNNDVEVENLPSYIEYIESENEYKNSDKYVKDEEFWKNYLDGINETVSIKEQTPLTSHKAKRYSVKLGEKLNSNIITYCKENRISPYALFLSALSTYIYRIKDKNDFVLGTPVLNRANFKEKNMLGMFVSTLPLRIKIEEGKNFLNLAKEISRDTLSVFRHQKYPYMKTLENIRQNSDIKSNLYNIVLSYQNARTNIVNEEKYSTSWAFSNSLEDELQIHIMDMDDTGILNINYDYKTDLYEDIEIEYLHTRLLAIIENAIENKDIDIENIRIMSKEEHKILYEINNTTKKVDYNKSLGNILVDNFRKNKDDIALITNNSKFTYSELDRLSSNLARVFKEKYNIKANDIIGIMMHRTSSLVIALLATIKCGAVYIPIDPEYPTNRIKYILNNSNVKNLIVNYDINQEEYSSFNIINCNNIDYNTNKDDINNIVNNDIYIIYTSGSTGNPKGVVISNNNLLTFLYGMQEKLKITKTDTVVSVTTISFDIFGLELWLTLFCGGTLVLADEVEQTNAQKLNDLCIKNNVNIIQTTPTKLMLLMYDNKHIEYIKRLDKILLGGEALNKKLLLYLKQITNSKIYNVYGPTETTIWSTIKDMTNTNDISVGKPILNTQTYILDDKKRLLPLGQIGQLYILGEAVSKGYYNRLDLTNKAFFKINGKNAYCTGDIACINFSNELEVLGRADFQVKINGQRIEIGEIEENIINYDNIENCVVIYKDNMLICFYKTKDNKKIDEDSLRKFIGKKLYKNMIPNIYYYISDFPMTNNGKIDRKALYNINYQKEKVKFVSPKTDIEKTLANILLDLLKLDKISINDKLFELGFDSLTAIRLSMEIKEKLNVSISANELLNYNTIKEIDNLINNTKHSNTKKNSKDIIDENKEAELTSQEKSIFAHYSKYPDTILYNVPFEMMFSKEIDVTRLKNAIEKTFEVNKELYTKINIVKGKLNKQIDLSEKLNIDIIYLTELEYRKTKAQFVKPFDIINSKLYKINMYVTEKNVYVLCDIHHIIFDGESVLIFIKNINSFYNGENVVKNNKVIVNKISKEKYKSAKQFYINKYSNEVSNVTIPTDYNREKENNSSGIVISKKINKELFERINKYTKANAITLNTFFLSVFNFLLAKYCYNEDIVIGVATTSRDSVEKLDKIGMLVNTIPFRTYIDYSSSIYNYLKNTQNSLMQYVENSCYTYSDLIKDLNILGNSSENSLFSNMFVYQNLDLNDIKFNKQKMKLSKIKTNISKFDLTCEVVNYNHKKFIVNIEYSTKLYKRDTINRLLNHYIKCIDEFLKKENLNQVELISNEEKAIILNKFNDTSTNYPNKATVHELFEKIALEKENEIAVIYNEENITFGSLNKKANQLARKLKSVNVKKGDVIAILADKSFNYFIGMLAILKAGACYLPIDLELPSERIEYMLESSNAKLILKESKHCNLKYNYEYIDIDDNSLKDFEDTNLENINSPDDMAYIMFTSGSTGKPKGCINTHRGIIKLVKNINYLDLNKIDYIFWAGNMVFDSSLHEMWLSMLNGIKGVIIDKNVLLTPNLYNTYLQKYTNILLIFTTQLFHQYAENCPEIFNNVVYIMVGGDVLKYKYVKKVNSICKNTNIINIYGPAECSAASTTQIVNDKFEYKNIPIGYPISNTKCLILDKCNKICPINVNGILHILGDGVGLGYINNKELTNKLFTKIDYDNNKINSYNSGDIAKWLPNGNILFEGRNDKQVKIRGYRIEISEIENEVLKYSKIKEACVVVKKYNQEKVLVVYFVSNNKIDIELLKKKIASKLPAYMVPKFYMQLDSLPLKPNGKLDDAKLPDIKLVQKTKKEKLIMPSNYIEEQLEIILKDILALESIGVNQNLFSLGLDSILVTRLCAEGMNRGIKIIYSDVFDFPTIKELASQIINTKKVEKYTDIDKYNYENINKYIKSNHINKEGSLKDILLTGANGFLGTHILADYLDNYSGKAYCIVRKKNNVTGKDRLKSILKYYFSDKYDSLFDKRIIIVDEEILSKNFIDNLNNVIKSSNITCAIHSAACVKHYGRKEEFYRLNVEATEQMIKLCSLNNIKLVHISTLSVSGNSVEVSINKQKLNNEVKFTEQDLYVGQKLNTVYSYTKYLAELRILEKSSINELNSCIIRVGNLMGRSYDGKFQRNKNDNAFIERIKFLIEEKIISKSIIDSSYIEMTPVDLTARCVLKIAKLSENQPIYHLYNNNHYSITKFLDYLKSININVEVLDDNKFYKKLKNIFKEKTNSAIMSDLNAENVIDYSTDIKVQNDITNELLAILGFNWPEVDYAYLNMFLKQLGFIKVKKEEKDV